MALASGEETTEVIVRMLGAQAEAEETFMRA